MARRLYSENTATRTPNTTEYHMHQDYPQPDRIKPGLIDLINKHKVSTIHLAHAARLHVNTVRAMTWQRKPVQPVVAMQLLYGLLLLTGQRYILTDVDIAILPYK